MKEIPESYKVDRLIFSMSQEEKIKKWPHLSFDENGRINLSKAVIEKLLLDMIEQEPRPNYELGRALGMNQAFISYHTRRMGDHGKIYRKTPAGWWYADHKAPAPLQTAAVKPSADLIRESLSKQLEEARSPISDLPLKIEVVQKLAQIHSGKPEAGVLKQLAAELIRMQP